MKTIVVLVDNMRKDKFKRNKTRMIIKKKINCFSTGVISWCQINFRKGIFYFM